MKFSDHLATHITPEWRKQYINYEVSHAEMFHQHRFQKHTFDLDSSECILEKSVLRVPPSESLIPLETPSVCIL